MSLLYLDSGIVGKSDLAINIFTDKMATRFDMMELASHRQGYPLFQAQFVINSAHYRFRVN